MFRHLVEKKMFNQAKGEDDLKLILELRECQSEARLNIR
jgi:hypothetical protein